jgi:hypothetical protein
VKYVYHALISQITLYINQFAAPEILRGIIRIIDCKEKMYKKSESKLS